MAENGPTSTAPCLFPFYTAHWSIRYTGAFKELEVPSFYSKRIQYPSTQRRRNLKTRQPIATLDLYLRQTREGWSHDHLSADLSFCKRFVFKLFCSLYIKTQYRYVSNSSVNHPSRIRDRLLCGFKMGFEGNSSSFVYGLVKIFSRKVNKCIRKRSRKEKKIEKINEQVLNWIFSTLNKLVWKLLHHVEIDSSYQNENTKF